MRCKNCGCENDESRYICANCGSPLYDENDLNDLNDSPNEKTQTFKAVRDSGNVQDIPQRDARQDSVNNYGKEKKTVEDNKFAEKKSITVIVILVVVLVAIIASVIAIAGGKNSGSKEEESELTKISSQITKKDTTEEATEEETEKTTEETTASEKTWIINTSSSGGGETEGGGEYKNGDKVVLIARADDGYVFDGWYSNGIKVSSDTKYKFSANENASFSAVFNPVETTTAPIESTTAPITQSSDTTAVSSPDVVFGE